jgi:uncharacterized protein
MSTYPSLPPEGHVVRWSAWDGDSIEESSFRWENEGWTVEGFLHGADVQYVLRLNAAWRVQQFMLFRDLDEPDLWLATDGAGRWGEVNGAHRVDLDACTDIDIALTPVTDSIVVRRLPLHVGHAAEITVALVDVDTLGVVRTHRRYARLDDARWRIEHLDPTGGTVHEVEVDVDDLGFVVDYPGLVRRLG